MKKSILFILILCGLFFKGAAQNASFVGSVSGSVTDSLSKTAIDYAVISLIPEGKTAPVNGTTTDVKGHFSINNIPAGNYIIKITFLGYRDAMRNKIHIDQQSTSVNLGTIALAPVSHMLHDVNITAKRPTIQNKADKLVYDPSNDLTAQGGSAVDILKKVPMVTVDVDGNIELLGSPGINFLINGKPSSMFGTSLADALQTIPASQIKNIEVITNPGAKYDAQGTGGIINIILKDSNLQGVNGTVNLAAGTRLTNGSFNLNARKNNFGVNAFFSGNDQYNTNSLNTRILTNAAGVPVLNQQGNSRINRKGYQSGLNFDWKLSKYDDLTAMIGYNRLSNHTYGLTSQSQTMFNNPGTASMLTSGRNSDSRLNKNTIQWSMGYKKTFKKENQELDVLYQSNISNNQLNYSQLQQYDNNVQPASGNMSNAPGKIHETSVEVNYNQPISKNFTIETGGKGFFKTIENQTSFFRFDPNLGQYVVDPTQANNFRYDRNIYAYYLSANFKAFNYLDVKLGGRYEYTYTRSDFAHIPGYSTFNPTLLIARQLDESQLIKISYSHRIERPDYGVLNPFVDRSDPYNIFTGNPLLNPEIGNNFELGYSKSFKQGASLNITVFYRKNSNDIQSYTVFYPTYNEAGVVYDNVSFTQRINTGAEIRAGGNISASLPVSNNFNLRTNILVAHKSVLYDYQGLNQDTRGMEYRVNLNAAYDFSKSLSAEAFANYNSPRIGLQGTYPSFFYYTLAVKKTFWHNNASIGVSATDPFNAYINQTIPSTRTWCPCSGSCAQALVWWKKQSCHR